jgi:hypothetical protein
VNARERGWVVGREVLKKGWRETETRGHDGERLLARAAVHGTEEK